jgi:ABC-type phosphate transport system substrate-binding protein
LIKRIFKTFPILLGILTVALVVGSGSAMGATQTTSQQVVGSGSDTTYFMMTALGDLYNQAPGCNALFSPQPLDGSCPNSGSENKANFLNYFHDFSVERFPVGSSGGVNQLCKHGLAGVAKVDFARSSRVPLGAAAGGSDCAGLRFVGYARDGITWECFPGSANPCHSLVAGANSLTQAQLKSIYVQCTVNDWSAVGGSAGAMDIYVPQANSGTGISWAAYLGVSLASGQALDTCIPAAHKAPTVQPGQPGSWVGPENTNSLIVANGDQAHAIFPFSVGVYHFTFGSGFTGSDGSSLGKINGVQATAANILSGSFPASRFVFNVYCKGTGSPLKCGNNVVSSAWTTKFVAEGGFICKNESKFNNTSAQPILDPVTHQKYRGAPDGSGNPTGEIPNTISQFGFVPLKKQGTGSYCITQNT